MYLRSTALAFPQQQKAAALLVCVSFLSEIWSTHTRTPATTEGTLLALNSVTLHPGSKRPDLLDAVEITLGF